MPLRRFVALVDEMSEANRLAALVQRSNRPHLWDTRCHDHSIKPMEAIMKIRQTFEETFRLYPFAPLVELGIRVAERLGRIRRNRRPTHRVEGTDGLNAAA